MPLKVELLAVTPYAMELVAAAAHQCVSYDDTSGFMSTVSTKQAQTIIQKALGMGHTSVLEHASFSFAISGVSRSLSHQLVRFRIASYSQQSQRYVKLEPGQLPHITPPSIAAHSDPGIIEGYEDFMVLAQEMYQLLIGAGIPAEDARFVLPNATETALVMSMNARQLRHAFNLRCCVHAQWEIREMFHKILDLVRRIEPVLFENAGPHCTEFGTCPEGARSCGRLKG